MNRELFYSELKKSGLFKILSQSCIIGINDILDLWETHHYNTDNDLRKLAYILGTTYHETGTKMLPVEEVGKGKGRKYGGKVKHSGVAYVSPNKIYYGRGRCQTTWYENYELMGKLIGEDLLNFPEKLLQSNIDVKVLFEGMFKGASSFGDFTGKCLEMYFTEKVEDWISARKIINGLDCAEKIAEESKLFYKCLKLAEEK